MNPSADRSAIRLAVERIRENLAGIQPDRNLSTPQTVALYLWLIDSEHLSKMAPIDRFHAILMSSLENQIITRDDQETMQKFCLRFLNDKNPGAAGDKRKALLDL